MRSSLIILSGFVLGVILSLSGIVSFDSMGEWPKYTLYLLIFVVGVSVGLDKEFWQRIKKESKIDLLLPFVTIFGTLSGGLVAVLVLNVISTGDVDVTTADTMAISSGFGYYSLSSILINESRGAFIATIALTSNILRELITLLLAPVIVKYFGPLALISAGGATSMDSTLPVITKYAGLKYVPLSVYNGVLVDFSVPFLVTLFISLN